MRDLSNVFSLLSKNIPEMRKATNFKLCVDNCYPYRLNEIVIC